MNNTSLNNYIQTKLKNPSFKKQWDASEVQYQITREIIAARIENQLSQRQLAKKAHTTQAVLSRIENMTTNPSLDLLQRIASALGKRIELRLA